MRLTVTHNDKDPLLQFAQTRIVKHTQTTTHTKELFSIQRNVDHKIVFFNEVCNYNDNNRN